jgi:hypothetical protein
VKPALSIFNVDEMPRESLFIAGAILMDKRRLIEGASFAEPAVQFPPNRSQKVQGNAVMVPELQARVAALETKCAVLEGDLSLTTAAYTRAAGRAEELARHAAARVALDPFLNKAGLAISAVQLHKIADRDWEGKLGALLSEKLTLDSAGKHVVKP